jgi:alpha-L-rhamnosidase
MTNIRRIITENPHVYKNPSIRKAPYSKSGEWPVRWICCENSGEAPYVTVYRKIFNVEKPVKFRAHVSADERYELFIDGDSVGRGSERGDHNNWFFETYDLEFGIGSHVIAARTWVLGEQRPAAQISVSPGFIFFPESENQEIVALLGTGISEWETKKLNGYEFTNGGMEWNAIGARLIIHGDEFPWGFENGGGNGWKPAVPKNFGNNSSDVYQVMDRIHLMKPATLPPMMEKEITTWKIRFVEKLSSMDTESTAVEYNNHLDTELEVWEGLLTGTPVTIPPNTGKRIIADLENYFCAYPAIVVSNGKGSTVRIRWAEALYDDAKGTRKSNRNSIEGKFMLGGWDMFKPDGGSRRRFDTLWWSAGRYVEIFVQTREEPLTLEWLKLVETRYPLEKESSFACDDKRLEGVIPVAFRSLQMCSHETYMDCPYYEQMMYAGDTRLQVLSTLSWTLDSRLPKKAVGIRCESGINHAHMIACAYPAYGVNVIPSFCLWWISMVHDYALWRGEKAFIRALMPKARDMMDRFLQDRDETGLVKTALGWNFYDWANDCDNLFYEDPKQWSYGVPSDGGTGINSIFNLHLVLTLNRIAQLEDYLQETELAGRANRLAAELMTNIVEKFWDEKKGMFADDLQHQFYSEHAQCIAILAGMLESDRQSRVVNALLTEQDIARASVYFSHYVFEALKTVGRADQLFTRLEPWFQLGGTGLKTTPEIFSEITRSDCHAWGAHPIYHYLATILGIRPGSMGFGSVEIKPQLGPLTMAKGTMVHPGGEINVSFSRHDNVFRARILLPDHLFGTFSYGEKECVLTPGMNEFEYDCRLT